MCGIVGAVVKNNDVLPFLLRGLRRMEYRGYDSAGLAVIRQNEIYRLRRRGKVQELLKAVKELLGGDELAQRTMDGVCLQQSDQRRLQLESVRDGDSAGSAHKLDAAIGIAHTRWATHGAPSEQNAHPQMAGGRVLVVHNGIIENFELLKRQLIQQGEQFESDTDTEVIAKLIHRQLLQQAADTAATTVTDADAVQDSHSADQELELLRAVHTVIQQLTGSFAIAVLDLAHPDQIVAAAWGAPIVLGLGASGHYLASDPLALVGVAEQLIYMHNHELVLLTSHQLQLFDPQLQPITDREAQPATLQEEELDLDGCSHYMLKEIREQPMVAERVLDYLRSTHPVGRPTHPIGAMFCPTFELFGGAGARELLPQVRRVYLVACGTSYYAALLGRFWLEGLAKLPCQVELASEFRYHPQVIEDNSLLIVISQSGETADTLAALRAAQQMGFLTTLAICNVQHSSIMREAELTWLTRAGTEIGVASTKAMLAQLLALALLALSFQRAPIPVRNQLLSELQQLPQLLRQVLRLDVTCQQLAQQLKDQPHLFYLGRAHCYPIALEGALKMKELSYLHAEGLAAGELKHGPLAMIEPGVPVIALLADDDVAAKVLDNLHEVMARGGRIIVFADQRVTINQPTWQVVHLPAANLLSPLLMLIPLQLLAYHVACLRGCNVDQPRNLAKSVTVE